MQDDQDVWTYDPAVSLSGLPLPPPALLGHGGLLNLNGDKEDLTGLDPGNAARLTRMWSHCLRYSRERKK